jgi:hypothetical protein
MCKLKKKALVHQYFKNGRHNTLLTRLVTIVISSDGNGLARLDELSRLLGGSLTRVGVGGLIMTGKITWVLILAAHDGVWRRGDREVSSGNCERGEVKG